MWVGGWILLEVGFLQDNEEHFDNDNDVFDLQKCDRKDQNDHLASRTRD